MTAFCLLSALLCSALFPLASAALPSILISTTLNLDSNLMSLPGTSILVHCTVSLKTVENAILLAILLIEVPFSWQVGQK